jgi:autotransporter-associated beta strand protein
LQGSQAQTLEAIGTGTLTISGVIADENGSITTGYSSDTAGLMIAGSGTVKLDADNTYSGGTTIESGTLSLGAAGAAGSGDITFGTGDPPVLAFALADAPANTIDDFLSPDAIDITDLRASEITSFSFDTGSDVLTIDYTIGGSSASLDLNFSSGAGGDNFQYINDGHDGTLIVCYYPGTGIRTPSGDVAVECLRIGDSVMLADGGVLPVRWIGHNTVSTRFADPLRVLPIRIRAGALAEGLPERDLLVSPEHAILVEDILVQAGALVNGVSIIRECHVPETFTYYHVELAEHALLLAEGLPAESFVDNVHRTAFDNWEEHVERYGDAPVTEMSYPRAQSRRQVPAEIHARLITRATECSGPTAGMAA